MEERYDVIVAGSGIAGTCAALCAAQELGERGRVLLASSGPVFSGSSFFRGTWGLGLVGPAGLDDEDELVRTICEVGCGQVDRALVESFVGGISAAVERVEAWGVTLRHASQGAAAQAEYVPCFDHKHRSWRGLECASYRSVVGARLEACGVSMRGGLELLDVLADDEGAVRGAVLWDEQAGALRSLACGALVLAGGGAASLFSRRLTSGDCKATQQSLALRAGARLVNMEFMQFMPGMVSSRAGLVFNEKTFKYMRLEPQVEERLGGSARARQLLEQRSGYGPFTSRLESRAIDLAVDEAGAEGLLLQPAFPQELPEFVQVYNSWLEREAGIDPHAALRIALYAHASNGGIAIDSSAWTGVPGLYAAGECTGGMHGADRLGGLSTANCLVFGMRAGESAARWALRSAAAPGPLALPEWAGRASGAQTAAEEGMRRLMDTHCMALRTRAGLGEALCGLAALHGELEAGMVPAAQPAAAARSRRTGLRLATAAAMVRAAQQRPESCGSHCLVG